MNRIRNRRIRNAPIVPTLVEFDGKDYFEHIVAFDCPSFGNGGIYTEKYWQSVLDIIQDRALGGSKAGGNGHDSEENDFFVIGGKIEDGKVYLKLAIPEHGFSTSNVGLIQALKNGVGEFSIVAHVKPRYEGGQAYFDKELDTPRLDYVSKGAMKQANFNSEEEKKIFDMIRDGKYDLESESEEIIVNGKVSKRWAVKNQNSQHSRLAGQILQAIAEQVKKENEEQKMNMTKEEIMQEISKMFKLGEITLDEITKLFDIELANEDSEAKAETLTELLEVLGLDASASKEEILEAVKKLLDLEVEALATEVAETDVIENEARKYAFQQIKNSKDRAKTIKDLESDSIFLTLKNQTVKKTEGISRVRRIEVRR